MDQLFNSPISDDHLLRTFVMTRLISARRLAPWRHRISSPGSFSFTASVRVVHGIHRHAAHVWANAAPARASGFTQRNIFVLDVSHLADSRATLDGHAANLAGRHAQLRMISFFGEQLRKGPRSPRHLAAFAGPQLDIMNLRTQGNVTDGQSVAGKNIGIFAAGDRFADFQTYGSNDVALLAIEIGNQSYIGRAIRIVFDLR